MTVQVLARDVNLNILGVVEGWSALTATVNFNQVGVWTLTFAAFPVPSTLLQPGCGVVIIHNGAVFLSGPVDTIPFARDGDQNAKPGTLTVAGSDDLAHIAERVVYPDPTATAANQTVDSNWMRTGVAGKVMTDLVNANASQSAPLVVRRVPGLVVADASSLGSTSTTNARFSALADELRTQALAGGNLGFKCSQTAGEAGLTQELLFQVYQPRDLSLIARFSFEMGNLRSIAFSQSAPTVSTALVAGEGVGTDRTILEFSDSVAEATWGRRVEQFVDQRDTSDPVQLAQAGADALSQGSQQVQLSSTTVDSPTLRFGVDDPTQGITGYGLGDQVSVSPYPGTGVVDIVRAVTLTSDATNGELVTALIGSTDASTVPAEIAAIRSLNARISYLERSV